MGLGGFTLGVPYRPQMWTVGCHEFYTGVPYCQVGGQRVAMLNGCGANNVFMEEKSPVLALLDIKLEEL